MKQIFSKLLKNYSLGRFLALITVLWIFFILVFILQQNKNASDIYKSVRSYKSLEIFEHTHISGNEINLIYLPSEKDNIESCALLCLERHDCVAANNYKGNKIKNNSGQCWLFGKIDVTKLTFTADCCELIVPTKQKSSLNLVKSLRNNKK